MMLLLLLIKQRRFYEKKFRVNFKAFYGLLGDRGMKIGKSKQKIADLVASLKLQGVTDETISIALAEIQ
jgi:hypothetical protein